MINFKMNRLLRTLLFCNDREVLNLSSQELVSFVAKKQKMRSVHYARVAADLYFSVRV
jgi:hypothetical protein